MHGLCIGYASGHYIGSLRCQARREYLLENFSIMPAAHKVHDIDQIAPYIWLVT